MTETQSHKPPYPTELAPAAPWQPIETAPWHQDILAWWPTAKIDGNGDLTDEITGGCVVITEFTGSYWQEPDVLNAMGDHFGDDEEYVNAHTHWMPLPSAPSMAAAPEQQPADPDSTTFTVGDQTMARVFQPARLKNLADLQAVLDATESALLDQSARIAELEAQLAARAAIRADHAAWSQATFGNVGPVGPLKHLAREALEAAANPADLSEWADLQFLLWDAQRRAGYTDEQIIEAMSVKLTELKKRAWAERRDGEPIVHIREPASSATD